MPLTLDINEDFTATPAGTLVGNATHDATNDWMRLTEAVGSQNGQYHHSRSYQQLDIEADIWAGGGDGADALYVFWKNSSSPASEDSNGGGYVVAADEYGGNTLQLLWQGAQLTSVNSGVDLDDSTWRKLKVIVRGTNIKVYLDGSLIIDYDDIARTYSGDLVGVGGRTGGLVNEHRCREFKVWEYTPDALGEKIITIS